jgi:hypothetical protein
MYTKCTLSIVRFIDSFMITDAFVSKHVQHRINTPNSDLATCVRVTLRGKDQTI